MTTLNTFNVAYLVLTSWSISNHQQMNVFLQSTCLVCTSRERYGNTSTLSSK